MQPHYLPYSGYFNLIDSVDKFVVLDDVQFEKQSWQSRNRVLNNGQIVFLSVPVKQTSLSTTINNIEFVDNNRWVKKHRQTIEQSYSRAPFQKNILPFMEKYFEFINALIGTDTKSLAKINKFFIESMCAELGITTEIYLSSELNLNEEKRSLRLLSILEKLDCSQYLSPVGAKSYLNEDKFQDNKNIDLLFQKFSATEYPQFNTKTFQSKMSVVDLVANCGFDMALSHIRNHSIKRNLTGFVVKKKAKDVLFLGYDERKTRLVKCLRDNNCNVIQSELPLIPWPETDLVVMFGYRHILSAEDLKSLDAPVLNLHISLLPFNKGAHPNFWAFYDNTPSGVTIHLADEGIDTGPLIYQRELFFDTTKITFSESYKSLLSEIENMFIENISDILRRNYTPVAQTDSGSHHTLKQLPSIFKGWDENVCREINRLKFMI